MSSNPFLSQWLSAANATAGAWRGFWTAEFSRQQAALAAEWQREAIQFWTQAMTTALRGAVATPGPVEAAPPVASEPLPSPATDAQAIAAEAQDEPAPAPKPAPAAKRPAARAATHRVKSQAKRGPARSPSRRGPAATRH